MAFLFVLFTFSIVLPELVFGKATLTDCGGEHKKISINSGSVLPDPIQYPGNVSVTSALVVLEDLPASNFMMKIRLDKLQPRQMKVPCLDGFGSCDYDICEMLTSHKDLLCPMFPAGHECKCPMTVGNYNLEKAPIALPNLGDIFIQILKGGYKGNITMVDTTTNQEVGCIGLGFEIVPGHH